MSSEKTEKPTWKRLRDAQKKGQVSKSQDFTSALMFIIAIIIFWFGGSILAKTLIALMQKNIERAGNFSGTLNKQMALDYLFQALESLAMVLIPLFLVLFVAALLLNFVQVGAIISFESLKFDFNKLNPAEGFKNKFLKPRPYIELAKTIIKISITFAVTAWVIYSEIYNIPLLIEFSLINVGQYVFWLIFRICIYVGIAFIFIAIADFFLQKLLFLNQMKMSKQEIKQERKDSDGDPMIKSKRRRLHKEILKETSKKAIQKADVVVVNPTHIAVALKYEGENMEAPTVVAKGMELFAQQIREIAKDAGVPIIRNVPLARELYEIEVDEEIPEELFEIVAEVLQWVYSLQEEK